MGYRPLEDFHLFSLTKRFPNTPNAIYICIYKTVPGVLDVTRFLSLDVTVCYVVQLNIWNFLFVRSCFLNIVTVAGRRFWRKFCLFTETKCINACLSSWFWQGAVRVLVTPHNKGQKRPIDKTLTYNICCFHFICMFLLVSCRLTLKTKAKQAKNYTKLDTIGPYYYRVGERTVWFLSIVHCKLHFHVVDYIPLWVNCK